MSDISLSKEDFVASNWEGVVNRCDPKECWKYSQLFGEKAKKANSSGDLKNKAIFTLLSEITFPELKFELTENQFQTTEAIESIKAEDLEALRQWVSEITDAELRARVADLIWVIKGDHSQPELAISSYLESANNLEDSSHWTPCFRRIQRALQLSLNLEKKNQINNVVAHIECLLDKYKDKHPFVDKLQKLKSTVQSSR